VPHELLKMFPNYCVSSDTHCVAAQCSRPSADLAISHVCQPGLRLSLCLTKYHAMKTYGGVEIQSHTLLTSELDGIEWSASRLAALPPGRRPRHPLNRTPCRPQSRSERGNKEKISPCSSREWKPGRPVHCPVTLLTELPRLIQYLTTK